MKKSNSTQSEPTMCYDYANQEKEYVFCVKGRPFPCLVSPHLPTPTASLIDYDLVRDTGLKMSDLQCQKFSYAGYKMRILGKVSLTVQCIHDGVSSGTFHLKGNVVLNLAKNLDTECIAGIKAKSLLERDGSSSASSASSPARTPAPTPPPARTPAPSPPPARPSASKGRTSPPSTPPRPQHGSPSPHQPSSPPGFPPTPQYPAPVSPYHNSPHIQVSQIHYNSTGGSTYLSPVSANIQMLRDVFNDADINNDLNHERCALFMHDEDGEL